MVYFGDGIAAFAARQPSAPAIVTDAGIIDFAGLQRAIDAQADGFRQAGVGPGLAVALVMRDRPEHAIGLFALQRLGAAVLLIAPADPPALRSALAHQAGARVVVGAAEDAAGWAIPVLPLGAAGDADAALPAPPRIDDVCFFRRSSGTTGGVPRLTPSTHRHELAQFEIGWSLAPWGPGHRLMVIVSTSFEFGRKGMQHALIGGGAVVFPPQSRNARELTASARRLGATWMQMTPTHLRHLLESKAPRPLLPGVGIVTSSAALTVAERDRVMAEITPDLFMMYGTNEVGILACARPEHLLGQPGTVGRLPPAVDAEVVDAAGRALPAGAIGELRFRHPAYPTAYAAADPDSPSRFADGWFHPGDLGRIDADRFVYLKGRTDDVINVGGQKVYPADIEECLAAHPAVAQAAAIGVRARLKGEAPVAAVVLRMAVAETALLRHCVKRLGAARSPVSIHAFDDLPKTAAGKIDRRELERRIRARSEARP